MNDVRNSFHLASAALRLTGGGEMGERIRAFDWEQTPLGPIDRWPQSLLTVVRVLLNSRYPMFVWWGRELINIYNDAYVSILGPRHPVALGRSAPTIWVDIWDTVGPQAEFVLSANQATWNESLLLVMERFGYSEETYFTFSYSPVLDDNGLASGVFCVCTEDTERVLSERRLQTLRDLGITTAYTVSEAIGQAAQALAANSYDLPFALIYLLSEDRSQARLHGAAGIALDTPASAQTIDVGDAPGQWPLRAVHESSEVQIVSDLMERFGRLPGGPWPEAPTQAVILPITKSGQQVVGFLIAGISPRRRLDDAYTSFLSLITGQVATMLANAQAYEQERQRAEALAELDQAKTTFLTNVSHEFRTPLTLLLGPLEAAVRSDQVGPELREELVLAQRNALRLLKLVNTLLDFSRIEAGRMQIVFEATDLAAFTEGLASSFRSAIEHAGLRFEVDCPPLPQPIAVDHAMWEKIVLNLLSNALKYTFTGSIGLRLRWQNDHVDLQVSDTGVGIPQNELPHLFERFYRVRGTRSRSHEGSGIGLALVQELIQLHAGTISVQSEEGAGTTFTVSIPTGAQHLSIDTVGKKHQHEAPNRRETFVEEALRWFSTSEQTNGIAHSIPDAQNTASRERILIADDNADMRLYIQRLLGLHYEVETVADGAAALAAVLAHPPALILADVMMPELDGFALIRALRSDERTREVPIILLSARAGEESRIEGLTTGADDYLVKPFSAHELLARVASCLSLASLRRESTAALRESEARLRESEAKLRRTLHAARIVVWEWDFTQNHITTTDTLLDVCGVSSISDVQSAMALLHPDDIEHHYAVAQSAITHKSNYHTEFRIIRPDTGQIVWLEEWGFYQADELHKTDRIVGVVLDITVRKQAEEALRQSEARFRSMADNAPVMIWVTDSEGYCTFLSTSWYAFTGQMPETGLGDGWLDAVHPDDRAMASAAFIQANTQHQRFQIEYRLRRHDGVYRWAIDAAAPHVAEDGVFLGFVGSVIDITERKEAEQTINDARRLLEMSLNASHAAAWSLDVATGIVTGDANFAHLHNVDLEHLLAGKLHFAPVFDAIHPADRRRVEQRLVEAVARREDYEIDCRIVQADGSLRWVISRGRGDYDDSGHPLRFVGLTYDITARVATEEALRESESRLRTLADNIAQFAWMADASGWIFWYNQRWFDYTGTTLEEMEGWGWRKVHHPDHIDRVVKRIQHSWDTGEPWEDTFPLRGKDGTYRWFLSRALPIHGIDGRVVRWFGTNTDITEQLAVEAALREKEQQLQLLYAKEQEARQQAETASRLKDEFLATVSHELRTPLTSILGYGQLLQTRKHDEAYIARAIDRMVRSAKVQAQLIEDILDVSRIVAGKLRLDAQTTDLIEVINAAIDTVRPAIDAKGLQLLTSYDPAVRVVHGDANRLQQVIWNLLSNAIKFTPRDGTIAIRLQPNNAHAQLTVADTGQGIDNDFLPYVFDRFRQAEGDSTRSYGGLGLGLSIVRHLVELHGGTVRVESGGKDQGATFTVSLPLARDVELQAPSATAETSTIYPPELMGRRILVVDDQRDILELVQDIFGRCGAVVQACDNAREALSLIQTRPPDLLVSDISMPGEDGYWLIRALRALPSDRGGATPAIALTAYTRIEDRTSVLAAGFQMYVPKPVVPDELLSIAANLARVSE